MRQKKVGVSGFFTKRLVDESAMETALNALLEGSHQWTFSVTRSPVNKDAKEQSPIFLIRGKGSPFDGNNVVERLRASRAVFAFIEWPDEGSAIIDVTERKYQQLTSSRQAEEGIQRMSEALENGKKGLLSSTGLAALLVFFPLILLFLAYIVASLVDPKLRAHTFKDTLPAYTENTDRFTPQWLDNLSTPAWSIWPALLTVAVGIGLLRYSGGGLKVWPQKISKVNFQIVIRKAATELSRFDNWRYVIIAVVIGVATALLVSIIS